MMGSRGDLEHAQKIAGPLTSFGVEVVLRVGSAHRTPEHALAVRSLPWHHRDPFDRLLIAQALEGGYTIVTADDAFAAYGVPLLRT